MIIMVYVEKENLNLQERTVLNFTFNNIFKDLTRSIINAAYIISENRFFYLHSPSLNTWLCLNRVAGRTVVYIAGIKLSQ